MGFEIIGTDHLGASSGVAAVLKAADKVSAQAAALALARTDADDAAETIGTLLHERDGLACRVQELEAERSGLHGDNVRLSDECQELRAKLERLRSERDSWRARVESGSAR